MGMVENSFYTNRQTAALFGVSLETIRNWAYEFAEYLSPTANPGKGKHRLYSPDDLAVFGLVDDLKKQGRTYSDIHVTLKSGQRGYPPNLDPNEVQAIVVNEQEKRLSVEVEVLQRTCLQLQKQLDEAETKVREAEEVRATNIRLETLVETQQQRVNELKEQLDKAQGRIEQLLEESGKQYAKGMMEALERRGDLRPKE